MDEATREETVSQRELSRDLRRFTCLSV